MIYRLMRRDPAWKAAPWIALTSAVAWVCPPPLGRFGGAMLAMGALFGGLAHRRAGRFETGLPIEARDLLLARALSLMAVVWFPALAGAAARVLTKGVSESAAQPLALGALCTLVVAIAQAAWFKEPAGPVWTLYSLGMPLFAAGKLLVDAVPLIPPLCAVAGIGVFVWVWSAVPRSFQLSSAGPGAYKPVARLRSPAGRGAFPWAPVVRSVCSWQYLYFVPFLSFQVAFGQWLLAPFWLVIAWQSSRMRTRWLWALPVGRRALLWTMIGPLLVANVLGYFAGFYLRQPVQPDSEPRVMVVTLAAILAYVMLTILFCVLLDWRGFARIPRRIPMTVVTSFFVIWFLAILGGRYFGLYSDTWARDALAHFGRTVRLGLPALLAIALAILIALYWAIEKVFSEPDFADKPPVSRPDAWQ